MFCGAVVIIAALFEYDLEQVYKFIVWLKQFF